MTDFSGYKIGDLTIAPNLVLAPMSGVTTSAFRRLIKELNPGAVGLVVTEFVSVEAMTRRIPKTLSMMKFREVERPIGIQIFGYDVSRMIEAAKMVEDAGADVLDINCGCPAPKVVKKGGGCELMRQPEHLAKIFREVRKAVKIPLTMKMRSGWDEKSKNSLEIAKIAQAEGFDAIAIHGRTRSQLYRGEADWSHVEIASSQLAIPVLGSGDIVSRESALTRLTNGVAGLMIGRGALSNPYIFSDIVDGKDRRANLSAAQMISIIKRYIELLSEDFPPIAIVGKLKQLSSQMCRGQPWRKGLLLARTLEEMQNCISIIEDSLFSRNVSHVETPLAVNHVAG